MAFTLEDFDEILEFRQGGTAKVYIATQKSLNRKVVIKEMTCGPGEESVQKKRFENEAKAAAALDHDNVIRIYDFGEKGNSYYITMEYVDGPDLEELLHNRDFPSKIGLAVVLQALKGLRYSHQHGIVHRDVKPANILVSRNGRVKVADFGLAHAGHRSTALTASGMMVGTPQYMSPEQVNGDRTKDPRMDIWAVGVLLYRILTGKHPFEGASLPAMVYSIVYTKETTISEILPDLPRDLAATITLCLEKNPEKRLPSLDPLIESLQEYLFSLGIKDPAEEIGRHPAVCAAVPTQTTEPSATAEQTARRGSSAEATRMAQTPSAPLRKKKGMAFFAAFSSIIAVAIVSTVLLVQTRSHRPDAATTSPAVATVPTSVTPALPKAAVPQDTARSDTVQRTVPAAKRNPPIARVATLPAKVPSRDSAGTVQTRSEMVVPSPVPASPAPIASRTDPMTAQRPMPSGSGELHVMTFPSSVEIVVDGVSRMATPMREPLSLPVGKHELLLRKEGYVDHQETIAIAKNGLRRVRVRMEKSGGATGK